MRFIKISLLLVFAAGLWHSCSTSEKMSRLELFLSEPERQNDSSTVFMVLFSNSCPNCYHNINTCLNYLSNPDNFPSSSLIITMPEIRQKEKEKFFNEILPFDTIRHRVYMNNEVIQELQALNREETTESFIAVYAPGGRLKAIRKMKTIGSLEELRSFLR